MGLLDVFKKKKPASAKAMTGKKVAAGKKKEKKPEKIKKIEKEKEIPLEEVKLAPQLKKVKKKEFSEAYKILKETHITEKATELEKGNKYIFKIFPKANKTEVKKAVQDLYGVAVLDVNIINIHRKTKRVAGRRRAGYKGGYKKAIVTLYPGEKIELLPR